jgi:predicted tellurium resistance membrane protein TerC
MDWANIFDVLLSLLTLSILEIVLGVDNLVFISIASSRLPSHQQKLARRVGLIFALGTRLLLLAFAVYIIRLKAPLFTLMGEIFSASDLLFIGGGLFLILKSTLEIHTEFELHTGESKLSRFKNFFFVVIQIGILDIIFSLDSVMTAVGMTQKYWIMATAITIAIFGMIFASEPLSRLVTRYPTIKMLALSFLLLIGTVLIADGFDFHIPRPYVYFAVAYSIFVEVLNNLLANRKKRRKQLKGE